MSVDKIRTILKGHLHRYPKMQVEDFYKLCHHACMGSEHAISNIEVVRDWLMRELKEMGEGPDDPLMDEIASDGRIIRVHLRPFLKAGGEPLDLLEAFVKTAEEFKKNEDLMLAYGEGAKEMGNSGELINALSDFDRFFAEKLQEGFPAVHHSLLYEDAYRPAYRVVARTFFKIPVG